MSKEVSKAVSAAAGQAQALRVFEGYEEYAGKGFEGQSRDDLAIPFIAVLQALSPAIEKLPGAKAGMLMNTVTEELYAPDLGVLFVPALTKHCFVEWVPRKAGGGFVAVHELGSEAVTKARAASTEFGSFKVGENDLVETYYIYGVLCDEAVPVSMAVIAFTSTKIKVYKKFNTKVYTHLVPTPDGRRINPPLFANLVRVRSFKDSSPKGEFYNFELVPAVGGDLKASLLAPTDGRFQAALDCKRLVESGAARAAFESQGEAGQEANAGAKEAPF
jgi:hypothetical protein